VIIPFYNLGRYINEALDSVLASRYQPFEVIIVDDGSDDPYSLSVLRRIEQQGVSNVRVVRHAENRWLAATRNTGVLEARGEFIAFVDADDKVEPEYFSEAVDILKRYDNVDFVYSWIQNFGGSKWRWITWNTEFPYLLGHNMVSALAVAKRSSWLAYGMNRSEIEYGMEDYDGWVRMVAAGCYGVSIPKFLVQYRVRRGVSLLQQLNRDQALYLYDFISQHNQEMYRRYGVELFNLQNANGPGWLWPQPASDYEMPRVIEVRQNEEGKQIEVQRQNELDTLVYKVRQQLGTMRGWQGAVIRRCLRIAYRGSMKIVRLLFRLSN
jgi:glycosyltransferase involved in cell wall biosynthesis